MRDSSLGSCPEDGEIPTKPEDAGRRLADRSRAEERGEEEEGGGVEIILQPFIGNRAFIVSYSKTDRRQSERDLVTSGGRLRLIEMTSDQ